MALCASLVDRFSHQRLPCREIMSKTQVSGNAVEPPAFRAPMIYRGEIGGMASNVILPDRFPVRMRRNARARAWRYREKAARFRRMAKAEAGEKLRASLLSLAEQYDELASSIAPRQDD